MKKLLKWTGIVLLSLTLIVVILVVYVNLNFKSNLSKTYSDFEVETLDLTTDSATLVLGERLTFIKGCRDCHGKNLEGRDFINTPDLGLLRSTNLTGRGEMADWAQSDWLLALKHGVDQQHKPLFLMPAHETALLSNKDMTALVSYLNTLPASGEKVERKLDPTFLTKALTVFNQLPGFNTHKIDHQAKLRTDIVEAATPAYGEYLAVSCIGCHRDNFKGGGPIAPGFPPVPDITSTGNPGKWELTQFTNTLRYGKTPEGKILNPEYMPWPMTAVMTEMELEALYLYLQSI